MNDAWIVTYAPKHNNLSIVPSTMTRLHNKRGTGAIMNYIHENLYLLWICLIHGVMTCAICLGKCPIKLYTGSL